MVPWGYALALNMGVKTCRVSSHLEEKYTLQTHYVVCTFINW